MDPLRWAASFCINAPGTHECTRHKNGKRISMFLGKKQPCDSVRRFFGEFDKLVMFLPGRKVIAESHSHYNRGVEHTPKEVQSD